VVEKIVHYCHRVSHPLFLGEIAVEVGISLSRAEEVMVLLVDSDQLRFASARERLDRDAAPEAIMLAVVGKQDLQKAHKP